MKRALLVLAGLFLASPAAAQAPSPAQLGITPTTNPENLQVLDSTKTWVPLGAVDPTTHSFTPVGGGGGGTGISEADILVTDPTVGMAAATSVSVPDNAPHIGALMSKMGPANRFLSGYDVTFPAVPGQTTTEYYFSQPLVLSRGGNYHCSGTTVNSSTYLIFAAGIDGVIQEKSTNTADGGAGNGMVSGCTIMSMGYGGAAVANPVTANVITGVNFLDDPAVFIPKSTWRVGDGIILVAENSGSVPINALPAAPIGTTVTGVSGSLGSQNLTLSNPVSSFLGSSAGPYATALFTQTGSNNFNANDTINVGTFTYKFVASLSGQPQNSVLLGKDFPTSAANLVAAIMNTAGQYVTYVPSISGPAGFLANPEVNASYASGVITFTSDYGGPAMNLFPSVYTASGTAAGTFGGATFSGALDASTCPAPCNTTGHNANVVVDFYQLPGPNTPGGGQAFQIQSTVGSNSITIISGPRQLHAGDVVWSDAFPFGSVVDTVTALPFPITATIKTPPATIASNALVTHAPGAEGNLWIMPTALKRRVAASSEHNTMNFWPFGMQMVCNSSWGAMNCDGSRDKDNIYIGDMVGRWVAGNNTATSSSIDEMFADNHIVDIFEGASLGSVYVNPGLNDPEGNHGHWSFLLNCANGNGSMIFGSYYYGSGGACSDPVNVYPPTYGGPLLIGSEAGGSNGPNFSGSIFRNGTNQWRFLGGNDGAGCVGINGLPGSWFTLAIGLTNCLLASSVGVAWDPATSSWVWAESTTPIMRYVWGGLGSTGYIGPGSTVQFPLGILLAGDGNNNSSVNDRLFGATNFKPTANWHLQGDAEINTVATPGGQSLWYYAPQFSTTLTAAVVKGTTTSVTVTACPSVAPPAGTLVSDTNASLSPRVNLGVYSSCTAGTLTFTAAALNNSVGTTDPIQFLTPYPAGTISNDPVNPDFTATTIRSGSSANKDLTGRIALAGGTATYTLAGVYATAPDCVTADVTTPANANSVVESTTTLTFTGTGTDTLKWICAGRN